MARRKSQYLLFVVQYPFAGEEPVGAFCASASRGKARSAGRDLAKSHAVPDKPRLFVIRKNLVGRSTVFDVFLA